MAKQDIKVNGIGFNAEHYAGWTESDFIKDQLASVPDNVGTEEQKKAFLKEAFAKVSKSAKPDEKPGK